MLYLEGDGAEVLPPLFENFRFDHIFYTGSTFVGKIIYKQAAEKLVPVTLELGGKSPAVLTSDANVRVAARRIANSKFSNCGQMCVAPDYVLVPTALKDSLIEELIIATKKFYGEDPENTDGYGKIINEKQWQRLVSYLQDGKLVYGGKSNAANLFIEPTLLTDVALDSKIMQDEIFGPVLPVLPYDTLGQAIADINERPRPLAIYWFGRNPLAQAQVLAGTVSGGVCVNDTLTHIAHDKLPFGGVGDSGWGAYHGITGFLRFSQQKPVMLASPWSRVDLFYPPYGARFKTAMRLIKRLF